MELVFNTVSWDKSRIGTYKIVLGNVKVNLRDRHRLDTDTLIPSSVLRILAHKYRRVCVAFVCANLSFFSFTPQVVISPTMP